MVSACAIQNWAHLSHSTSLHANLIQRHADRLRTALRFDTGLARGGAEYAHARAIVHAQHLDAVQVGVGHVPADGSEKEGVERLMER